MDDLPTRVELVRSLLVHWAANVVAGASPAPACGHARSGFTGARRSTVRQLIQLLAKAGPTSGTRQIRRD
jgi:hypothetical protein